MLAIDTNVVVRYVTGDHPTQSARAKTLVETERLFVGMTVLLETEWVLRSVYGFSAAMICKALRAFAGLPHVTVERPAMVAQALDWTAGGVDFADALHLAAAAECEAFMTFDQRFATVADRLGALPVRVL
jgi:predicted nucleic acid-binding protein